MSPSEAAFAFSAGAPWGAAGLTSGSARSGNRGHHARRLGLPDSTQQALYHVYESAGWMGPERPEPRRDYVASAGGGSPWTPVRCSLLGGVDTAATAVRDRAGVILDPRTGRGVAREEAGAILAEVDDGDHARPNARRGARTRMDRTGRRPARPPWRWPSATWSTSRPVPPRSLEGRRQGLAAGGGATARPRRRGGGAGRAAGLLHDVGQVGVSNAIWEEAGGPGQGPLGTGPYAQLLHGADPLGVTPVAPVC